MNHIWRAWEQIKGRLIMWETPQTIDDVLNIPFWYHPEIGRGKEGNSKKFNSKIWQEIWRCGAITIGDIWDPKSQSPQLPNDGIDHPSRQGNRFNKINRSQLLDNVRKFVTERENMPGE